MKLRHDVFKSYFFISSNVCPGNWYMQLNNDLVTTFRSSSFQLPSPKESRRRFDPMTEVGGDITRAWNGPDQGGIDVVGEALWAILRFNDMIAGYVGYTGWKGRTGECMIWSIVLWSSAWSGNMWRITPLTASLARAATNNTLNNCINKQPYY